MKELKQIAINAIEEKSEIFTSLSDKIWEYAELSLLEYKSTAEYVKLLAELGFTVEEKVAGIDTAFLGKFGTGSPVIGILGELMRFPVFRRSAAHLKNVSLKRAAQATAAAIICSAQALLPPLTV